MVDNSMWEQLGYAVVYQAMRDYEVALCRYFSDNKRAQKRGERMMKSCETFFKSADCSLYLANMKGFDGRDVMWKAKDNVIECDYNIKKLKRLHTIYNRNWSKKEGSANADSFFF
jgi:hypothetical protein